MQDERSRIVSGSVISRRAALKVTGAIAAATAVGAQRMTTVSAQESSPAASPDASEELDGKYVVVRSRTLAADLTAEIVMDTIRSGYVPLLRGIDGFVGYLGIADPASRQTAFVAIFADKVGTDASTSLAGEWLADNGYEFFEGDPIVVEGSIGVAAGSLPAETAGVATPGADGSPDSGENPAGSYVVVRSRKLKAGRSGDELLGLVEEGFLPLVIGVPGFIAYLAVANAETRDQFSIGIYADKMGADESTSRAAEWGKQGAGEYVEGDPIVIEGSLALAMGAS